MESKSNEVMVLNDELIREKIYTIRGMQVMLDRDIAELYEVETKYLKRQVRRNIEKFPSDFMFELNKEELLDWRCQFGTSNKEKMGLRYTPIVFTEQGIAMLASVINSKIAVQMSISIIRVFISMRKFMLTYEGMFRSLEDLRQKQIEDQTENNKKFEKVFEIIETEHIKPKQGVFFEGQIFDAYKFVSDLVRSAKKSIVLIDNYIDDTVLEMFAKRNDNVKVTILTKNISSQLKLDLQKYNTQHKNIEIKQFEHSHDRFMILDEKEVYHIGASLKHLGRKWFGFSKLEQASFDVIAKLREIL